MMDGDEFDRMSESTTTTTPPVIVNDELQPKLLNGSGSEENAGDNTSALKVATSTTALTETSSTMNTTFKQVNGCHGSVETSEHHTEPTNGFATLDSENTSVHELTPDYQSPKVTLPVDDKLVNDTMESLQSSPIDAAVLLPDVPLSDAPFSENHSESPRDEEIALKESSNTNSHNEDLLDFSDVDLTENDDQEQEEEKNGAQNDAPISEAEPTEPTVVALLEQIDSVAALSEQLEEISLTDGASISKVIPSLSDESEEPQELEIAVESVISPVTEEVPTSTSTSSSSSYPSAESSPLSAVLEKNRGDTSQEQSQPKQPADAPVCTPASLSPSHSASEQPSQVSEIVDIKHDTTITTAATTTGDSVQNIDDNNKGESVSIDNDASASATTTNTASVSTSVQAPVPSESRVSAQQQPAAPVAVSKKMTVDNFFHAINEVLTDSTTSDETKFGLLCTKILAAVANNTIHVNEVNLVTDNILKLLITDDMQRIRKSETLRVFFCDYLKLLPSKVVAEILSVIIAVLKKSILNLELSKDLLLVAITQTFQLDNLIKHFIREIINLQTTYSCNVRELRALLKLSEEDPRILHYIRNANLYQRNRPSSFFAFPGTNGSVMALPPFQKWPIQNGWTFVTWFRLEPNGTNSQPYLYYFRTSKSGVGYSAHFTGNCLVLTSMKIKGKGFQHCIPFEFQPQKWFHCAITYIAKWRSAEVKVYVNGQLTANTEMAWQVATNDHFDKCFIGGTPDRNDTYLFSGQIASIYLFHEALNPSQICSIHRLGASYAGEYRNPNESQLELPVGMKRVLYEERLSSHIFCLYTPVAVESDTLCLQCQPKGNLSYFASSAHAALLGDAKAIKTHPIGATLQSIGGVRALLPLLYKFSQRDEAEACSILIGFICDLLEFSPQWFGNEMIHSHGFITIASILAKNSRLLISADTLDVLLNLTKTLLSTCGNQNDALILKLILDNILFNPSLWVYVDAKIQLKLYCYLSNEFLNGASNVTIPTPSGGQVSVLNGVIFNEVRRISTVLQLLHSLKYYYWLVDEKGYQVKAADTSLRLSFDEIETIRSYILLFIKQLIIKGSGIHPDELQAILNYLATVHEDQNIIDVLQMLQSLMCEHPSSLIPAFDSKQGVQTVFKLLGSSNEDIRIQSLKLLGYFLSRSTQKRKHDVMTPNNLYMLLCEHLMVHTPLTLATYNALFEILTETSIESIRMTSPCNSVLKIENPMILKVLATLLIEGKRTNGRAGTSGGGQSEDFKGQTIKELFINDLWSLLINSRDNRRLVLQMSVWQHWLINLIEPKSELITNQILAIFRILLYHAIKYEFGGWRVWIDTLAIIHAKISFDDFNVQFGSKSSSMTVPRSASSNPPAAPFPKRAIFKPTSTFVGPGILKSENHKKPLDNDQDKPVIGSDKSKENNDSPNEDEQDSTFADESGDANEKTKEEGAICVIDFMQNDSTNTSARRRGQNGEEEDEEEDDVEDEDFDSEDDDNCSCPGSSSSVNQDDHTDVAPNRKNRHLDTPPRDVDNHMSSSDADKNRNIAATPAFRIPEFRWSSLHIKLVNDLLYSIEADLQLWRAQSSNAGADHKHDGKSSSSSSTMTAAQASHIDQLLQNSDNQVYIVNTIHLVSQLCDNIIISAGGLLPLLASATGGSNSQQNSANNKVTIGGEGFSASQANFLVYRLANLIDILCFAATHLNFNDLESEKNMSSGGILRQCLRVVCTIAVKNCLLIQRHQTAPDTMSGTGVDSCQDVEVISEHEYIYKGVSIVSSAELFAVDFNPEMSDLIAYKASTMDIEALHYQLATPIKDACSLLQEMDINRLRACIYRDADTDTKQSQFLALATLYFISVLMVSKYRDIIEPKKTPTAQRQNSTGSTQNNSQSDNDRLPEAIEMPRSHQTSNMSEKLTAKLETTLASICPLLREIICDFSPFLSRTLLGSHGQELVNKEAIKTFRRADASPVELVMLLCSQEWQNTLQKNAGLAFIELINEGRLLSHAMKDHIVRVAMEAEYILSRLRADDVTKHASFTAVCTDTNNARQQEETIINSLIIAAKRRDWMIFGRFKESVRVAERKFFKLDSWEDDARRRRRFVYDPLGEVVHSRLAQISQNSANSSLNNGEQSAEGNQMIAQRHEETVGESNATSASNHSQSPHMSTSSKGALDLGLGDDEDSDSFGIYENEIDTFGEVEQQQNAVELSSSVLYSVECCLIWAIYTIEGVLQITANELFFEAHNSTDVDLSRLLEKRKSFTADSAAAGLDSLRGLSGIGPKGTKEFKDWDLIALQYCDLLTYNGKISFGDIRAIFTRRYLLQPNALEIFLASRTSVMFAFGDYEQVKKVVRHLPPVGVGVKYGISQSRRASLMTPRQLFAASNMTPRWQKREISNFEYLMFLNTIAGRTYQDLNQYPVFPWILTNYHSKELDLSLPANFRDLSKPIGALNSERREEFIERYQNWDSAGGAQIPAFHYGTHYSTAAFTLGWLIRLQPFTSVYFSLQDGCIESESRLFNSMRDAWIACLMGGQQNVKELIPEFFYLPEIFSRNGPLADIELPQWAESPEHFIRVHRMTLESDLVSCQLHQWIDLIFGYKQRGPEAVRAVNVFYHLTYEGAVNLSSITDPSAREAIETQIRHFGQTPSQLTSDPHPPRSSVLHVSPLMFSTASTGAADELMMELKFPFNAPVVHVTPGSSHMGGVHSGQTSLIVTVNSHQQYNIHRWDTVGSPSKPFQMDPALSNPSTANSVKRQLVDLNNLCTSLPAAYVVSLDAKHIVLCPFYDNSFRVYSTDTGKMVQIIYGHKGIVTCMTRSEYILAADFLLATGSQDCSVLVWNWNAKCAMVEGGAGNVGIVGNPLPKLTLCGHDSPIGSVLISAELGIIASSSTNRILIHTTTAGECIADIDFRARASGSRLNAFNRQLSRFADANSKRYTDANIEASMMGKEGYAKVARPDSGDSHASSESSSDQANSNDTTENKNNGNKQSSFDLGDYNITNLAISRDLALIVGIAVMSEDSSRRASVKNSRARSASGSQAHSYLFSYNLKGALIKCIELVGGGSGSDASSKSREPSLLQTSPDGEYIILSECGSNIKILRAFDLSPLYALNTEPAGLKIRSFALVEMKHLLVGLDNGKFLLYNVDFNRWNHEYNNRYVM